MKGPESNFEPIVTRGNRSREGGQRHEIQSSNFRRVDLWFKRAIGEKKKEKGWSNLISPRSGRKGQGGSGMVTDTEILEKKRRKGDVSQKQNVWCSDVGGETGKGGKKGPIQKTWVLKPPVSSPLY